MKNTWKYIIGFVIILGIVYGIYKLNNKSERYFNKIEISKKNFIRNGTNKTYIDTIIHVGLNYLELEGVVVNIRPLTIDDRDDIEIKAHVVYDGANSYIIEVSNLNRVEMVEVLSHELIHITQFYSGRLGKTDVGVIWNNKLILYDNIPPYEEREWEILANGFGMELSKRINKQLYETP